jgi:hypothetical protein
VQAHVTASPSTGKVGRPRKRHASRTGRIAPPSGHPARWMCPASVGARAPPTVSLFWCGCWLVPRLPLTDPHPRSGGDQRLERDLAPTACTLDHATVVLTIIHRQANRSCWYQPVSSK